MNIRKTISIVLIFLLLPGCLTTSQDKENIIKSGKGYLKQMDNFFVLHLEGTPAEMGQQQGILLKEMLCKFKDKSWEQVNQSYLSKAPPRTMRSATPFLGGALNPAQDQGDLQSPLETPAQGGLRSPLNPLAIHPRPEGRGILAGF